ncbi:hypothetical protein [Sphingobium sp. DC-2]|uniref:hypothetical protein n=1 Tax=Sphingobium sp. DC-2 TaxID=1303256 RepID=UPI001ED9BACA|nr:hypothetical protein [Sphingobium sp. DC-2]
MVRVSFFRMLMPGIMIPLVLGVPGARAQNAEPEQPRVAEAFDRAGKIVVQPARDVGAAKTEIPPLLLKAAEDPYSVEGLANCSQLTAAIKQLNGVLGSDFTTARQRRENRAEKIAEAGGRSVVNALIPFRGVVREITGAASAQRRLNAAIDAGYARRGFLRGLHYARRCRADF